MSGILNFSSNLILKTINNFFLMLFMFLMISQTQAYTPCKSFPKFFGSGLAKTILYDMDVFDDYLAFGG